MVNSSPWGSTRSLLALRFLRASLAADHTVSAVYFRGEGVYHGLAGRQSDPGAEDLPRAYQTLASDNNLNLLLCSAAVSRRFPTDFSGSSAPWQLAGLAQWVELLEQSDRVVTF